MKTLNEIKHYFFATLWELKNTTPSEHLKTHLQTRLETLADILGDEFPEEYREQYEEAIQ